MRRLLLLALFALIAIASTAKAEPDEAPSSLDEQLAAIHQKARAAREKRDFARIEQLRLDRLALLEAAATADDKATAKSPWVAGMQAINEADSAIKGMQYEKACTLLEKAWQPFAKPARDEPVFGDVAMKLFEATQAALAVYPEFTALDPAAVKQAVQLAADADPCATEAKAADAFLTPPNPNEAFEPAELRPSLKARNRLLLDISYDPNRDERPLPWHAPAEYLKAQSSSFVLGDLGYGDRFLGPRRLLQGRDGYDEPFTLVMGGALLITARDAEGIKRQFVADYDAEQARWLRLRPRILRVEPPAYKPRPWQIDVAALNADIRAALDSAAAERQRTLRTRLMVSSDGLKAATKAKAHIRKILGWMSKPPKGQPAPTFSEAIEMVAQGYVTYAQRFPEEKDEAENASQMVRQAATRWDEFRQASDAVLAAAGSNNADIDAATAATALAKFLALIAKEDAAGSALAEQDDDTAIAGDEAKPSVLQLDARELQSLLSAQKEYYETFALFQLMTSLHRPALQATLTQAMQAEMQAQALPHTAHPAAADDQGPPPAERLGKALKQYDAAIEKAGGGRPAPDGLGPPSQPRVITLETLRQASGALREISAVLRQTGVDPERADFLDRFVRTLDTVAHGVTLEAEMVRFCHDGNLSRTWQVGRATWRVYDFPADTPQGRLAGMINACPRVALNFADFDRLVQDLGEEELPTNVRLPLLAGCTTVARNRLVEQRDNQPMLRIPRGIADPWTVVLLDVDPDAPADFSPALVDGPEGGYVWLDDDGGRVKMSFLTKAVVEPAMVVRFSGADGYSPLGASTNASDAGRILKDRRGNTITLDRSPERSLTKAHFYEIRSPSGEAITDRSVNYCIQDWLDLDRNIVNSFLPDVILLAPSLPTWRLYRSEYMRPAPRPDWKWTVPRRIFSLAVDPNAAPAP